MAADWYPGTDAGLIPWHSTFNAECNNYKVPLATVLTAGVLTQVGTNSAFVATVVNATDDAKNFANNFVAYKDTILRGPHGSAMPATPIPPGAMVIPVGAVAAIEDYTRRLVGQIKAHGNYTDAIGQAMGIVGPAPAPPGTPSVAAHALTQSQIELDLVKAGYTLLAIDCRRGPAGIWEQIGVAQSGTYIDARAPLVAGQPELREYRAQGMQANARVGPLSAISSAVTVP